MALLPKIESRIGITAPAEVVWEVVGDIENWPLWNPIYPKAAGVLRIGEKLSLTLALPGEEPRDMVVPLVDWIPNEQIIWSDTVARGWVKSLRYIEIETLSAESCIFSNGELFQGFVAPYYITKPRRRALRTAFTSLCEAVRERSEALWGARAGGG